MGKKVLWKEHLQGVDFQELPRLDLEATWSWYFCCQKLRLIMGIEATKYR